MSAATSNLHDQFHAMLQNMKQAPAPPSNLPTGLSGGALVGSNSGGGLTSSVGQSVAVVTQKDNIGLFFKKHWGKILALCIIVVVVTVFMARFFISKRKKNRKLKEAQEGQENIQWEQYFAGGGPGAPSTQTSAPQLPSFAPQQPHQQPHHQPQQQQQQQPQQPQQQQPQQPQQQQQQQQPQQQQQQQQRPSQRSIPVQIQQISAQLHGGSVGAPAQPSNNAPGGGVVPPRSAVVVPATPAAQAAQAAQAAPAPDPRIAAAGINIPQRQPKEKEADIPKSDTDHRGKPLDATPPTGKVIDQIVVA